MDDKKKKTKGENRYGNPPKIGAKKGGDADKSGHEEKDKKSLAKTAGDKEGELDSPADSGPTPSAAAGTGEIPVHERHAMERKDTVTRQAKEMHQMHNRHAEEVQKMSKRHMMEMGGSDKSEGESGTEPD